MDFEVVDVVLMMEMMDRVEKEVKGWLTESGRGVLELGEGRSPDTWEVPEGGTSWQPPWPPSQVQVSVRGPPRLTFSVLSVVNIPLVSFTRQEVGENRRRRNNINVSLKGSTYNRFENTI